jgi:hypothetical protein
VPKPSNGLGGRAHDLAVDGDVVQACVDAAHHYETAFSLIDLHRYPGNPAQRFRGIRIREAPDRVGGDDVHDRRRRTLLVSRERRAFGH